MWAKKSFHDDNIKCAICGDTKGYKKWYWNFYVCKGCAVNLENNQLGCVKKGYVINWSKYYWCFVCGKIESRMWLANPLICEQCGWHYGYLHNRVGTSGKPEYGNDAAGRLI